MLCWDFGLDFEWSNGNKLKKWRGVNKGQICIKMQESAKKHGAKNHSYFASSCEYLWRGHDYPKVEMIGLIINSLLQNLKLRQKMGWVALASEIYCPCFRFCDRIVGPLGPGLDWFGWIDFVAGAVTSKEISILSGTVTSLEAPDQRFRYGKGNWLWYQRKISKDGSFLVVKYRPIPGIIKF